MIEVVFSNSAYGARKVGLSKQHDFHSVVLVFELALDIGPIDGDALGEQRLQVLRQLGAVSGVPEEHTEKMMQYARDCWEFLKKRADQEAPVRIWVSSQPGEVCGMVWLLSKLEEIDYTGEITVVPMPEWEYTEEGSVERKNGWAETEEWGSYVAFRQSVNKAFRTGCVEKWQALQQENAPLRVLLNGRLTGMSANVYDYAIEQAVAKQPDEFSQVDVILDVLRRYLGIGDGWIALRMEKMIRDGMLEVAGEAPDGNPAYRRMLRKV